MKTITLHFPLLANAGHAAYASEVANQLAGVHTWHKPRLEPVQVVSLTPDQAFLCDIAAGQVPHLELYHAPDHATACLRYCSPVDGTPLWSATLVTERADLAFATAIWCSSRDDHPALPFVPPAGPWAVVDLSHAHRSLAAPSVKQALRAIPAAYFLLTSAASN